MTYRNVREHNADGCPRQQFDPHGSMTDVVNRGTEPPLSRSGTSSHSETRNSVQANSFPDNVEGEGALANLDPDLPSIPSV